MTLTRDTSRRIQIWLADDIVELDDALNAEYFDLLDRHPAEEAAELLARRLGTPVTVTTTTQVTANP